MKRKALMRGLIVGAAIVLGGALAVAASGCDGEDRPGVDVIDDGGSGTGSGTGTGTGSATGTGAETPATGSGTGTGTGTGVEPGVVDPKPEGAVQVDATLSEWAIELSQETVPAGQVYFLAENVGPDDPHELVVIKTDVAPDALPVENGQVPEDEVDMIGEIHPFSVGTEASMVLDLEPGNYVLICNIVEQEDGELESHYELGMTTRLVVE